MTAPPHNGPSVSLSVGEGPTGRAPVAGSSPALAVDGSPLWDGYANPKDHDLRVNWGIKLSLWEEVRAEGGDGCPVCLRRNVQLVVDEDHATGEWRGLPCDSCNRKMHERIVAYLADPPARRVARRRGLAGFFIPVAIQERKAAKRRERQARRAAERNKVTPVTGDADSFGEKTRAALRTTGGN